MSKTAELSEPEPEQMQVLYEWVDTFPLSRPKKNIARDFADGILLAEIVHRFFPKLVALHNYSQAHAQTQKEYNWNTLNSRVFSKLGFQISTEDIEMVTSCTPGAIEKVLLFVKDKLETAKKLKVKPVPNPPPADALAYPRASVETRAPTRSSPSKDQVIEDLKETIECMETKIIKLEQLAKLKDSKIQMLVNKLAEAGLT